MLWHFVDGSVNLLAMTGNTTTDRGIAVVDVETTGLYNTDRIVEIAVVCTDHWGRIVDEYETLIDPDRDVGPSEIHGVTASMVSAAPRFEEVAETIADLVDGRVFAAHNASFDARFVRNEFNRIGVDFDPGQPLCTLNATGARLNIACEDFGIELREHHRALHDARATALLLSACGALTSPSSASAVTGTIPPGRSRTLCRPNGAKPASASELMRVVSRVRYPSERPAILTYLDALDWALNDHVIDAVESAALQRVATELGISSLERDRAHERYLDAVIEAVERDSIVTADEHQMMTAIARCLGIQPDLPAFIGLPMAVEPRAGWTVCFTGSGAVSRDELHRVAERSGLVPASSVTKRLDLLVAADPHSASGKAKKARAYGIPMLSMDDFVRMVNG